MVVSAWLLRYLLLVITAVYIPFIVYSWKLVLGDFDRDYCCSQSLEGRNISLALRRNAEFYTSWALDFAWDVLRALEWHIVDPYRAANSHSV